MVRFSYTFSFIPLERQPGSYMFYMNCNRWVKERCVSSVTIFEKQVTGIPEVTDPAHILGNGQGMADLAYQLVSEEYAKRNRSGDREINARPGSASVPS